MADEQKTLGQLVADLQQEYGEHHYGRIDLHIPDDIKNAAIARARTVREGATDFDGMRVLRIETLDGIKFFLDNPEAESKPNAAETWLLLRASGTEPLMRIYCESVSLDSVKRLLEAGRSFALSSK
jgi:phosphomannomutase